MMKHAQADRRRKTAFSALFTVSCCVAVLALSGCGNKVKQQLGLGRNSPDEFMVVKRAPLTLPPDYDLRAPGTAQSAPQEDAVDQAKTALLGRGDGMAAQPAGSAETELMDRMGVQKANPDIRAVIDRENGYIALKNKPVVDKLIFWDDQNNKGLAPKDMPTSIVDAKAEAERLRKNKEEGKPVNAGDVPVIEKKKSAIDKIF